MSAGYRIALDVTAEHWDRFVATHPDGHVLQTSDWGRLKVDFGWCVFRLAVLDQTGQIVAGAQVLGRRAHRLLPIGMAYVPAGPLLSADPAANTLFWQALHRTTARRGAIFLKVEPCDWYRPRPELRDQLIAQGFHTSSQTIQPPRTVVVDLSGDENAILKRMNQSTRYKARLAAKKEVDTRCGTLADVDSFNALMATTGTRDAFGVHAPAYYRRAFELFAADDRCALILASHAGQDLAGVMIFRHGAQAYYLYGASSNEERNRMPTYIAQWAAMRWAHDHGATSYDLWGVPDEDEAALDAQFENRHDGLWGVYGAKRGWGGAVVRSVGAWDRVYVPAVYALYQALLRRRTR